MKRNERGEASSILVGIAVVVIAVGVLVGGWFGYWALREHSANREQNLQRNTFEFQQTSRQEVVKLTNDLADVDVQIAKETDPDVRNALVAQRAGIAHQLCSTASDISSSLNDATVATAIAANC